MQDFRRRVFRAHWTLCRTRPPDGHFTDNVSLHTEGRQCRDKGHILISTPSARRSKRHMLKNPTIIVTDTDQLSRIADTILEIAAVMLAAADRTPSKNAVLNLMAAELLGPQAELGRAQSKGRACAGKSAGATREGG